MEINLTDNQIKNLFAFLDRVEVKGLTEVTAMMELVHSLNQVNQIKTEE